MFIELVNKVYAVIVYGSEKRINDTESLFGLSEEEMKKAITKLKQDYD